MATKSYEVARNAVYLRTNNGLTAFNTGDRVELEDSAAKALLERAWIKPVDTKPAKKVEAKPAAKPAAKKEVE